jgi:hypothetical protein
LEEEAQTVHMFNSLLLLEDGMAVALVADVLETLVVEEVVHLSVQVHSVVKIQCY